MGNTHYNYRVVRCPPKLAYDVAFTQIFDDGFDCITIRLQGCGGRGAGEYIDVVE